MTERGIFHDGDGGVTVIGPPEFQREVRDAFRAEAERLRVELASAPDQEEPALPELPPVQGPRRPVDWDGMRRTLMAACPPKHRRSALVAEVVARAERLLADYEARLTTKPE